MLHAGQGGHRKNGKILLELWKKQGKAVDRLTDAEKQTKVK